LHTCFYFLLFFYIFYYFFIFFDGVSYALTGGGTIAIPLTFTFAIELPLGAGALFYLWISGIGSVNLFSQLTLPS